MANHSVSNVRFTSADGKSRIHGWVYAPTKTNAVALLQLSHGMCEYIGRYQWFMEELCSLGFVVFGHDHIGHGESSEPENYGFFGKKNGWQYLIADVHRMNHLVCEKYPELPLFLFGHSMGSFVARLYAAKYGSNLDGLILCGTGGPNPLAKAGISAAAAVAKLKGPMWRCPILEKMAFGSYNNKYQPQRTNYDWLTRDESIIDKYAHDPKCTFRFTACGFRDLFTMVAECNSKKCFRSTPSNLPVLLISGDMDPVGDYGKGVVRVQEEMMKAGMMDVGMILYPQARHELLNELNREEVLHDIHSWLKDQLPIPF